MEKYYNRTGVTVAGFTAGVKQVVTGYDEYGSHIEITLFRNNASLMYSVRSMVDNSSTGFTVTDGLALARKKFNALVKHYFSGVIADVKKDSRYTVDQEFCGKPTPMFVSRFAGKMIGQSSTKSGALVICAAYMMGKTV